MPDTTQAMEMGSIALPSHAKPKDRTQPGLVEKVVHRHKITAERVFDQMKLEQLRNGFVRITEYPNNTTQKMTQVIMSLPDGNRVSVTTEDFDGFGRQDGKTTTIQDIDAKHPRILMLREPEDTVEKKNLDEAIKFWDFNITSDHALPLNEASSFLQLFRGAALDTAATNEHMQRKIEQNGGTNRSVRNNTRVSISLAREMSTSS